jgi:hypothetical protein
MRSEHISSGRYVKDTSGWFHGANTLRAPWALPEDQYKWGVNITCRGGIVQTRAGNSMRLSLPAGNFQGGVLFAANKQYKAAYTVINNGISTTFPQTIYKYDGNPSTEYELPYILFAVDGKVYFSPFDLQQPKIWSDYQLSGIQLDPKAPQVYFTVTTKTSTISGGGNFTNTPSHRVVVMQDGRNTPYYWDGSDKTGQKAVNTPVGTWMAFSGNRLWVANNNIVMASDLGDPLNWLERTQGTGRGDFTFPRKITAMTDYAGQNNYTGLIVFTDRATYSLASGILDRAQWGNTANFQNTLFPTIGCMSGRSLAFQAGMLWWYSRGGLVSADIAASSYLSSQILYKDVEMARVKRFMAGDITNICSASFENYLLFSIPYLEPLNSSTMVMDYAPAAEWNQAKTPAWCGVWNGTRPVEWISGIINGQPRIFHFSVDYVATNDGSYNHLWESFMPERVDSYFDIGENGSVITKYNRIYCQFETALLGDAADLKQFQYSELELCELGGTIDLKVSYRGSKGIYRQILNTRLLAVTDKYQYENTPYATQVESLGFLSNQFRRVKTENAQKTTDLPTCETTNTPDVDKAFSILVEWCGEMGIELVRLFMDPWSEKANGTPQSDETKSCVVGETGQSITLDLLPNPSEIPSAKQTSWLSTKSYTSVNSCQSGYSGRTVYATATATYISYLSQVNADDNALLKAKSAADTAAHNYRIQHPCV